MSADPITQLAAKHADNLILQFGASDTIWGNRFSICEAIAAALREQREQHVESLRMLWITAKRHELPEWFQDEIFEASASETSFIAGAATAEPSSVAPLDNDSEIMPDGNCRYSCGWSLCRDLGCQRRGKLEAREGEK